MRAFRFPTHRNFWIRFFSASTKDAFTICPCNAQVFFGIVRSHEGFLHRVGLPPYRRVLEEADGHAAGSSYASDASTPAGRHQTGLGGGEVVGVGIGVLTRNQQSVQRVVFAICAARKRSSGGVRQSLHFACAVHLVRFTPHDVEGVNRTLDKCFAMCCLLRIRGMVGFCTICFTRVSTFFPLRTHATGPGAT